MKPAGNEDFGDAPTLLSPARAQECLATSVEGPGSVLGHYKLLEQIGEGGFGVVYLAEQREPVKRQVALKVIKLGMDTKQVVARFEAERQALALMDHPAIARVFDAGATELGRPYFVMELVRGIKITEYCDRNHLTTEDSLKLFIDVCHALQHAHQKGIIHRDIKPSNILVAQHDGKPLPKVIDFGIAKATHQELTEAPVHTQLHQFVGTPAYMSPEQAQMSGLDIDTRSDIYSLGVVLYELLVGSTPFDAKALIDSGVEEMRKAIRDKEPVPPSKRLTQELAASKSVNEASVDSPGETWPPSQRLRLKEQIRLVRGDLDWIVMKCLEKERARRYETASELAQDIERHLKDEPIIARPASRLYRFQKLARRNKLVFAATGAVCAALITGLGFSTWQYMAKSRAYQRAVQAEDEQTRLRQEAQTAQTNEARLRQRAESQELTARQRAYASDMNLAQQALTLNNLGRAKELLDRHHPANGFGNASQSVLSTNLPGWEWRYLWQLCRSDALYTLCQKSNSVLSLASSMDGKMLALGEQENGSLTVWDVRTRREVAHVPAGDGRARVAFSPREPLLAFTSVTGKWSETPQYHLGLWDASAQRPAGEGVSLGGECMGLAFSSDGKSLLTSTAAPGNELALWRLPDLTKMAGYPAPQIPGTVGTYFAADGNLSLAVHRLPDAKSIRAVDLKTGLEHWRAKVSEEGIAAVALSPGGETIAAAGGIAESTIHLFDGHSGKEIGRLEGHRGYVIGLLFWPDGKTLASASADQTIRLWDLTNSGQPPPPRVLRGHKLEVWSLALLPDGTTLASGSKDGSVNIWDINGAERGQALTTLPANIALWRFGREGKSINVLDRQGHVSRWQGDDFAVRTPLFDVPPKSVQSVKMSPDGSLLAISSNNGTISIWDLDRGSLLREFVAGAGPVEILNIMGLTKKLFVMRANDRSIHQWDFSLGQEIAAAEAPSDLSAGAVSADERWTLAVGYGGRALLADSVTGHSTGYALNIRQASDAAFSPDAKYFAISSKLGFARLWETETAREAATFGGFLLGAHSLAFSPDGARLAVCSNWNEAVKLWDMASHQELITLDGQGSYFASSAFSSDGNVLGAANAQGVLHLWRAPSWKEIATTEESEVLSKSTSGRSQF